MPIDFWPADGAEPSSSQFRFPTSYIDEMFSYYGENKTLNRISKIEINHLPILAGTTVENKGKLITYRIYGSTALVLKTHFN